MTGLHEMLGLEGRLELFESFQCMRTRPEWRDARPTDRWAVTYSLGGDTPPRGAYGRTISEALDNAEGRSPAPHQRQTALVMNDAQAQMILDGFMLLYGFVHGQYAIQRLQDDVNASTVLERLHDHWKACEASGELAGISTFMTLLQDRLDATP